MDIEGIRKSHRATKALSGRQQAFRDAVLGGLICILALGVAYAAYRGWAWMFPPVDPAIEAAQIDARDRKFAAEEGVRYYAKDPDSVVFREVIVTPTMVCGQYNAKNSFGAYGGFLRFVSDGKNSIALEEDAGRDRMDALWRQRCK